VDRSGWLASIGPGGWQPGPCWFPPMLQALPALEVKINNGPSYRLPAVATSRSTVPCAEKPQRAETAMRAQTLHLDREHAWRSRLLRDLDKPLACRCTCSAAHTGCVGCGVKPSTQDGSRSYDKDRQAARTDGFSSSASSPVLDGWSMPLARGERGNDLSPAPCQVRAAQIQLVAVRALACCSNWHRIRGRLTAGSGWGAINDGMALLPFASILALEAQMHQRASA